MDRWSLGQLIVKSNLSARKDWIEERERRVAQKEGRSQRKRWKIQIEDKKVSIKIMKELRKGESMKRKINNR